LAGVLLKDVVKRFKNTTAVDRLNIAIQDKEFAVLVGPSGCGRNHGLRMIAGLEAVSSGRSTSASGWSTKWGPKDRDIAMVFQNYALYPHMSVRKTWALG